MIQKLKDYKIIPLNRISPSQYSSAIGCPFKLVLANSIIRGFESVTPVRKFKSDWIAFVSESRIEDFERIDNETVLLSTIH